MLPRRQVYRLILKYLSFSTMQVKKTRAELMKDVDAQYYGFRDDDDGLLVRIRLFFFFLPFSDRFSNVVRCPWNWLQKRKQLRRWSRSGRERRKEHRFAHLT